jgi:hypothetical protein
LGFAAIGLGTGLAQADTGASSTSASPSSKSASSAPSASAATTAKAGDRTSSTSTGNSQPSAANVGDGRERDELAALLRATQPIDTANNNQSKRDFDEKVYAEGAANAQRQLDLVADANAGNTERDNTQQQLADVNRKAADMLVGALDVLKRVTTATANQ